MKFKNKKTGEVVDFSPCLINSALLSAQNRQRYYWANWEFEQPEDNGAVLADILEDGFVDREKAYCIDACYHKGGNPEQYFNKSRRQLVFKCGALRGRYINDGKRQDYKMKAAGMTQQRLEIRNDDKTNTLTTVQKDNVVIYQNPRGKNKGGEHAWKSPTLTSNSWEHNHELRNGICYRKLTCKLFQTITRTA